MINRLTDWLIIAVLLGVFIVAWVNADIFTQVDKVVKDQVAMTVKQKFPYTVFLPEWISLERSIYDWAECMLHGGLVETRYLGYSSEVHVNAFIPVP